MCLYYNVIEGCKSVFRGLSRIGLLKSGQLIAGIQLVAVVSFD